MHELIYRSRATGPFDRAEIGRILASARRRNAQHSVTGLLLFSDDAFLQVLEGEEAAVHEIFARIEADARHRDIAVLADGACSHRAFPDWSMGFRHLDDALVGPADVLDLARARSLLTSFPH